jgi:LEA14-like dessication related protein
MRKILTFLLLIFLMTSCELAQQALSTLNMTQCEYSFNSVNNVSLGGINVSNVHSITDINPVTAASLLASLTKTSGTLPISFNLNLDVKNPGSQTAALQGMAFILKLDSLELTQGTVNTPIQILAGAKNVLPVNLAFDLKQLLKGESAATIKNMAFAITGLGEGNAVKMTLLVKPNMTIGGRTISIPNYIPISFNLK